MKSRRQDCARRVFVTGMGCTTPLGNTLEETTTSLREGRSGIVDFSAHLHPDMPSRIAGVIRNAPIDAYVPAREQRRMDRFIQIGMVAGIQAWEQAKFLPDQLPVDVNRVGVISGVGMGGIPGVCEQHDVLKKSGPRRITPFFIPMIIPNLLSGFLGMRLGLKGPGFAVVSACASSAHAIGEAFVKIRDGYCDVMLAGGSESLLVDLTFAGFCSMKALSTRYNATPQKASRPFDKDRDGFVMAEGAAFVVLESEESVAARGVTPVAEVIGYGASSDAHHITQPAPEGEGGERAMRAALADGGISADQINYVNTHGTSTPVGDELELLAISKVMGDHAKHVKVSSTKSMTGHMLGAAGAGELIFSILCMNKGFLPPNLNLENPENAYGLDLMGSQAQDVSVTTVLSNSFGFGGTNASLIIRRVS